MSSEVQHSYQLRSRIPRPRSAFMLFAEEKRRSVADENPNENNQRVSSRLGELWRSLSTAVKEPYQRKAAEAAIVHRRNHPDYVYNPREAHRRKGQERRAKAVVSKPKNGSSGDQEQQPSISTAVAQDRGFPEFQHPPPPPSQRNERRGTSAARGSASGAAQRMPLPRPTATVTATASARSDARPYNVHRFTAPLQPSLRWANRENALPTTLLTAARAFKQAKTPYARIMLHNQVSSTLLNDEDDDSSAGTSSFDQKWIPGEPGLCRRCPRRRGRSR
ncbi:sex-determining region Y protein [Dermacentor silvarum]|uniref:sex-determining region Y protein n=1 Tax=Dermacentor silvarum TaxID=543639 RepID=UPI0018981407|nr:sex-determining region Y protein [Dermacentor silvarum]